MYTSYIKIDAVQLARTCCTWGFVNHL